MDVLYGRPRQDGPHVRVARRAAGQERKQASPRVGPHSMSTDRQAKSEPDTGSGFLFFGSSSGSLAFVFFQVQLANTYGLRCYLDQFIVLNKLQ